MNFTWTMGSFIGFKIEISANIKIFPDRIAGGIRTIKRFGPQKGFMNFKKSPSNYKKKKSFFSEILRIPLRNEIESLNVACTATLISFLPSLYLKTS